MTDIAKRIYLSDYKAPDFEIKNLELHFNLHEYNTLVKSKMNIEKINDAPLVLDGEHLKLVSIKLNDKKLATSDYQITEHNLIISQVPKQFQLEIEVEINPESNKSCEGLYLSSNIFCTQCEAESFRRITYFLDRPDVMTTYTVEIEADEKKYPVLLSNGDLIQKKSLGQGRHYVKWQDPFKKPSYLFALVAGDLGVITDQFTTRSGKKVKLEVFASHGKQDRCHHAMISLKKSMQWDEEKYGLEYDLNQFMIVSIDDFNMGAMENKGLNVFNSRLVLADVETATDNDFEAIESVVGHEYFHNWTGNRVTCRNWFELSLKEGLTVFRDQEFSADLNSRAVQRIKDVDSLRARQFSEDAGPNAHPVRPESCLSMNNLYTSTIYEKGAEVIRMMQTIVGETGFRKGMDEYFKRHDGQAVTIIDFAQAIADANKTDFSQFKLWYSQAVTPQVNVSESFDLKTGTYTLNLSQSCDLSLAEKESGLKKLPFHIPLKMGLLDAKTGQEITAFNQVLHLKESTQTWTFQVNTETKPVLSLNREFSAPVKLMWSQSHDELLQTIKYDTDAFNRREACSKMLFDEVQKLIEDFQNKKPLLPNPKIIEALGSVLMNQNLEPQFKALILSLPTDNKLAQENKILDAIAFTEAKMALSLAFVKKYESEIKNQYHQFNSVQTAEARALKNKLLSFLVLNSEAENLKLAWQQFNSTKNMNDKIYALSCLTLVENQWLDQALDLFYQAWHKDSVVFNKWLQVQASGPSAKTFERVLKAKTVSGYDPSNPNNISSLYGVLASNYLHFHTDRHDAYSWFADEMIRIDAINPQVAARLASAFNFTKKLPSNLREKAETQINRILKTSGLSPNTRELLEKI